LLTIIKRFLNFFPLQGKTAAGSLKQFLMNWNKMTWMWWCLGAKDITMRLLQRQEFMQAFNAELKVSIQKHCLFHAEVFHWISCGRIFQV